MGVVALTLSHSLSPQTAPGAALYWNYNTPHLYRYRDTALHNTIHFPGNVFSLKQIDRAEEFIKLSFVCLTFTHELQLRYLPVISLDTMNNIKS